MFKVEAKGNRIRVTVNERLVISHTPETPFAEVGKGRWEIAGRSVFDRDGTLTPLSNVQYDAGRQILRFFGGDYSISWHLSEHNGNLRLAPQRTSTGLNRMRLHFPATAGTAVYGGGAQLQKLNLRGKKISVWVGEQPIYRKSVRPPSMRMKGTSRHISGCPLPVYMTEDNTYFVFDCAGRASFDFTSSKQYVASFWDLPSSVTIGNVASPLECVAGITKVAGRQPVLPQWILEGTTIEGQGGSRRLADLLEKAFMSGARISCVYIPDWTGGFDTPAGRRPFFDWIWNEKLYPRLDALIHEMGQRGVRCMAYINPHLSIEGRLFAEASVNGYLVKKPQGGNYISDMGGFMVGHLDLTNSSACAWFRSIIRKNVMDLGFCGYFADRGEFLPSDAVVHSGESPVRLHNRWPGMWAALNRDIIREAGRTSDSVFYTRFGASGIAAQSMLVSTGDHHSAWNNRQGFPSALTAALSLSCSGIGLSMTDCGGTVSFLSKRSKELYFRWMEYSAFTPVFRVCDGDADGWRFYEDPQTLAHFARLSKIHALLGTYIRACVRDNTTMGYPVMRPLFMSFPHESKFRDMTTAYMLGSELCVFPVLRKGLKNMQITLPEGNWIYLWSGKQYQEGDHVMTVPYGNPPVFYRPDGKFAQTFEALRMKL